MKILNHPALPRIFLSLVIGLLLIAISRPIWNIDLFWHLAAGRWIHLNGMLPTTDIFSSLDPGRDWITFQWLYEWAVFHLEQWGGLALVRLVHAVILVGAFLLLFHYGKQLTGSAWAAVATCAMTLAVYDLRVRVRPHILILLFVVVLLPVFFGQWRERSFRRNLLLWVLPIALLANFHAGGALILLAILMAVPAGEWIYRLRCDPPDTEPNYALQASGLWAMCCLTAAIMPHFVRGSIHAITMLGASEAATTEWHPAWTLVSRFQDFYAQGEIIPSYLFMGVLPFLVFVLFAGVFAMKLREGGLSRALTEIHPTEILLSLGCTAIAIRYGRFVWLTAIPTLVILRTWRPSLPTTKGITSLAVLSLLFTALAAHGIKTTNVQVSREGLLPTSDELAEEVVEGKFPILAVHFMETADLNGKAWTPPGWGGYVLWKRFPGTTVSSDGRGNYDQQEAENIQLLSRTFVPKDRPTSHELQAFYRRHEHLDILLLPLPPGGLPLSASPPRSRWQRVFPPPREWLIEMGLPFTRDHQYGEAIYLRTNDSNQENIQRAKSVYEGSAARIRGGQ